MDKVEWLKENLMKRLKDKGSDYLASIYQKQENYAREKGLEIGGNPIPFIHLPHFVDFKEVESATSRLNLLIEMLCQMEKKALSESGQDIYQRLMGSLSQGGRDLVNMATYESEFSLKRRHRRVDAYLFPKVNVGQAPLQVIEVNQAAPLALHFHDTCQELAGIALSELDIPYYPKFLAPKILQWLVDEYQHKHPGKFPSRVALTIEHGYPPKFSDLPRMAKRIESLAKSYYGEKMEVKICFPYDLRLRSGTLYFGEGGSEIVNMVWRNSVYMNQYKDEGKYLDDYLYVLNHPQDFVVVNSTRSWLTRNKETFSVIWDDQMMRKICEDEEKIKSVRKIVPETLNLFYQKDKIDYILKTKNDWITKPSDAGFGQGVEFGMNHNLKFWENLVVERSSKEGYVFQKRVKYPSLLIDDLTASGDLCQHQVEYDFCPHHINGDFSGSALCRVNIQGTRNKEGKAQKMNLVSGGYMLPLIMID